MNHKAALLTLCTAVGVALAAAIWWLPGDRLAQRVPTATISSPPSIRSDAKLSGEQASLTRTSAPEVAGETDTAAGQDAQGKRLVIALEVRDEERRALIAATVELAVKNESVDILEAVTAHDGTCQFEVDKTESTIGHLTVKAAGYATYLGSKQNALAQWKAGSRTQLIQVTLRRACVLDVSVRDEAGRDQPSHIVAFRYLGAAMQPSDQSKLPDGVQPSQLRSTGRTGHALADDLERGWWVVTCDRWKNKGEGGHEPVLVDFSRTEHLTITVPSISEDYYASGFVILPDPMPAVSEHGTIDEYALDIEGHGTVASWLYEGGQFFVYGERGATMNVHVASRSNGKKSEDFPVTIGQHLYKIEPRWLP
jgi:hypothetical protein